MRRLVVSLIVVQMSLLGFAGAASARDVSPAQSRAMALSKVRNWGYQLQRIDVDALSDSPFDMMVIDHAPDRVESVELLFRRDELEVLKKKNDGSRRLMLAYVSIGEAERYRFYWDESWLEAGKRPGWLGPVNPQWVGNYPVEFWQPEWQGMMFGQSDSYVDRVLAAGFDGIYLDRADVYEQFKGRPDVQGEMASFLVRLIDHARAIKPDAIVVLQNAEELVRRKEVRTRIDAIAKESLFFNPDAGAASPAPEVASAASDARDALADLRFARKSGRRVLLVEYVSDPVTAQAVRRMAEKEGFLLHFAERSLSSLYVKGPDQQASAGDARPQP